MTTTQSTDKTTVIFKVSKKGGIIAQGEGLPELRYDTLQAASLVTAAFGMTHYIDAYGFKHKFSDCMLRTAKKYLDAFHKSRYTHDLVKYVDRHSFTTD